MWPFCIRIIGYQPYTAILVTPFQSIEFGVPLFQTSSCIFEMAFCAIVGQKPWFIQLASSHSLSHPCPCLSTYLYNLNLYSSTWSYLSHFPPFLCPSFSVLLLSSSSCDNLFWPSFFYFPTFHFRHAGAHEHCHGQIDTGWSVCSQHWKENECGCHASFPPDCVRVLLCVINVWCWHLCLFMARHALILVALVP